MMARLRHVVFDLDGTLADTSQDIAAAANHVRRAHGLPDITVAAVRDLIGEGARRLIARALPGQPAAEIDAALQAFLRYYESHLLDRTRLYPGIEALLAGLRRAGRSCSVLSNKPAMMCQGLVDGLGIASHFELVLGGDSLAARKPDPCGIEHLRARLDLGADTIVMVGDSPIDRDTARAAGVAFCGVAWGFASHALCGDGNVHVATTAADVLRFVLERA